MIGNHPQGVLLEIVDPEYARRFVIRAWKQVNLIIAVHLLHNRCNPLQPHTGIHRGLGQRMELAGRVTVVLHKHQVPNFDVTIEVFSFAAGWTSGYVIAMIEENFATGPAGTGVAHLPEVVFIQP